MAEENTIISEWEKTQAELDQAELEKRKAEEEAAKAETEKLKAETEKIREGESPSSTASETEKSESWKEVAELQAKRIDALAPALSACRTVEAPPAMSTPLPSAVSSACA